MADTNTADVGKSGTAPANNARDTQRKDASTAEQNGKTERNDPPNTIPGLAPASGATGLPNEDARRQAAREQGVEAHEAGDGGPRGGGVLDTYARGTVEHPNLVPGSMPRPVLGQAPVVSAVPMSGSHNTGERVEPHASNAINQSPVIRGVSDEEEEATRDGRHDDPVHDEGRERREDAKAATFDKAPATEA